MAIVAAIAAGVSIVQTVQKLSAGGKEGDRLEANELAYNAAAGGDTDALAFLLARSKQGVTTFVNGYGEIGGWATETARADAKAKYDAARAIGTATTVGDRILSSGTAQGIAQATGNTIVPGTQGQIVVVVLAAAVGLYFLAKRR